jgi:phosphoribosylaminoimidazolecarboxamide formyltransferase/IMP cyclohydrolase
VSTGGTAKLLRDAGLTPRRSGTNQVAGDAGWSCEDAPSEDSRAILFRRDVPEDVKQSAEHGIAPIDLVVMNLYPFSATARKAGVTAEGLIENIDIGGPAMVRAAAKSFESVAVVRDPSERVQSVGWCAGQ